MTQLWNRQGLTFGRGSLHTQDLRLNAASKGGFALGP